MLFLSFMNLFRNRRRTLAILLTIALGTGVLFSFKGFIFGVLNQYRDNTIHALYGHGQLNTKHYRENVYAEPWKHWIANQSELQDYLLKQKAVEFIFPRINFPALLKNGKKTVSAYGQGIEAKKEAYFFYNLNVESGQTLTDQPDGILLGIGLANALDVKPGDQIEIIVNTVEGDISQGKVIVTGIFNTGSLDFDNRLFRIQLVQTQSLLKTDQVELISIGLKNHAKWDALAARIEKAFPALEATSFAVLDKVYYQHSVDWLNAQFHVIQIIILSIVLLGIFNSISASILERKQEIGSFRANGESIGDIMRLITAEGCFLGILGGCLGIGLAFFTLQLLNNHILMPPGPGLTKAFYVSFQFEWNMVYTTLGLTTLAALAASALAGIKVAKMPIAKALRSV